MTRVIIPVDFSDRSRAAVDYACCLGNPNWSYVLLNTTRPVNSDGFLVSIEDIIEKDIQQKLVMEKEYIMKKLGNHEDQVLVIQQQGELSSALESTMNSMSIDCVILGTDGEYSWESESFWEEGKTLNLLDSIPLPVIVVPVNGKPHSPDNVLFATLMDGINGEEEIEFLTELAKSKTSHLDILNISENDKSDNQFNSEMDQTINGYFKEIPHDFHHVQDKDYGKAILEFSSEHENHLICLIYRHHGAIENLWHNGVSDELVHHSSTPILALKRAE